MSIDATNLPSELMVTPQPLICFCGLDVSRNPVHKTVWDAFSANRKSDRAAVQYKLISNYEFPVAKPKRTSYEWYQAKGILKRNWMLKHLHVLPALVVVFQDLEWNDAQWSEKLLTCASTIQNLRSALQERNTRLCLVLLQKSFSVPPGEDVNGLERSMSLAAACDLNSKLIYILPYTEHIMGYTLRLESAFLDLVEAYYAQMSKRIRSHRDQLTAAHINIKIRYQFKLGFVAEMRHDYNTGLKYYTQAYAYLDEDFAANDSTSLEIKTIAGILNYKICRLMFKLKVPRDAINHFFSHVEKYKNRCECAFLAFEHYGWLSSQHYHFAELFCDAVQNGLPALRTQHPGIYFHKAAEYIMKRQEAFQQSLQSSSDSNFSSSNPQINNSLTFDTEYFGVRAGKAGKTLSRDQINMIVLENEKAFNHSGAVISLLSQAMTQFKLYKCMRFRKKIAIDIAEEYLKSGNHAKALTFFSLMLADYRHDQWLPIFSDVLLKTLRCATSKAAVTDFIPCSLEALSPKIRSDFKDRVRVLENLWTVFHCELPKYQFAADDLPVDDDWENAFRSMQSPLEIDLDKICDIMDVHVSFEKPELNNNETVRVNVIIRLLTDVPLKVKSFALLMTDGKNLHRLHSTNRCISAVNNVTELGNILRNSSSNQQNLTSPPPPPPPTSTKQIVESDMKLEPGFYYNLIFSTSADQFSESTSLKVEQVEMLMGSDKLFALLIKKSNHAQNQFRKHNLKAELDDSICIHSICNVTPIFNLVTQTNFLYEKMIVNEFYPIATTFHNPTDVLLRNIGINLNVPDNLRNKVFLTTDFSASPQKLQSHIQLNIGELPPHTSNTTAINVFSMIEGEIVLQQKIWYSLDAFPENSSLTSHKQPTNTSSDASKLENHQHSQRLSSSQNEIRKNNSIQRSREDTLRFHCEPDFRFTGNFYSLNKKTLGSFYLGESFFLRLNFEVGSNIKLDILDSYFLCDHNLLKSTYNFKRKNLKNQNSSVEDILTLCTKNSTCREWWITKNNLQEIPNFQRRLPSNVPDNRLSAERNYFNQLSKYATDMSQANVPLLSNDASSGNYQCTKTSSDSEILKTSSVFSKPNELSNSRGFFKSSFSTTTDDQKEQQQQLQQQLQNNESKKPVFGVYYIKWRRHSSKTDNESKFLINSVDADVPPIYISCSIEEKTYLKMPMKLRIVIENPTTKVVNLVASLNISNTDNFICSGHKQLDVSIFALSQKELVYNLYPLSVGWQALPELQLEYNTQTDFSRDDSQNHLLSELIQRFVPNKVYVLPPLRQQNNFLKSASPSN